jgi:diaminopimelate epimerase
MIPFVKASACGNDFLIVDGQYAGTTPEELTRRMCDRNNGVGADGVEWVYPADTADADLRIGLINADGSHAEISGNGTRCVAAWMAIERGTKVARIETDAGIKVCELTRRDGYVCEFKTGMGQPEVGAEFGLEIGSANIFGVPVSVGNPHFVRFVDTFEAGWQALAAKIGAHTHFPAGTNVELVRVIGPHKIELRIFERGAGETLSSGTGTSAAAAAAIYSKRAQSPLKVHAPGGTQEVRWESELFLFGPARVLCSGKFFV